MCTSLTDYPTTYTSTEPVPEKYKIEDNVTTYKNRTNGIQRSEEEDNKQQSTTATTNTVF
jgi:hypothetical protein